MTTKIAWVVVASAMFAAGCDQEAPLLQYRKDPARDRHWVLTSEGVTVRDLNARRVVARIPLPDWHWAGTPSGCTPALAIGPKGEALVSSDILPTLWRIDPDTFAVTRHELALERDAGKDIGFSGLAYAAQSASYIAVDCSQGAVWRVDPSLKTGQKVSQGPHGESAWIA
jgi:hypothetical protein